MKFTELQLIEPILKALTDEGYTTPTPIQQQAIPIVLNKIDLLVFQCCKIYTKLKVTKKDLKK